MVLYATKNCVSLLYLSIGNKGRRFLTQKFPHDNIYNLTTFKMWEMLEIAFFRPRNIIFDRYVFSHENNRKKRQWNNFIVFSRHLLRIAISRTAMRQSYGTSSSPICLMTICSANFWEIQFNRNEHLALPSTRKWATKISREFDLTTVEWMSYNNSPDFAARVLVCNNKTERHSIAKQIAFVANVDKTGHWHTVRFALHCNHCSLLNHSQSYVKKNKVITKIFNKINVQ